MAKRYDIGMSDEQKKRLREFGRTQRILFSPEKRKRLEAEDRKRAKAARARRAKPQAAKPQAAKPQTAKAAVDAAPKKVVSKAPKQTEAQLAQRRAKFRELQKKYAKEEFWDNALTTGGDVGKELAGHAVSWIAGSLLMGPVAGTAAKLTKLYSQTKGGAATIKALGGRKFVDRVAKEAEKKAKAKIKKAATKTVKFKFKPGGKRPGRPSRQTAKPDVKPSRDKAGLTPRAARSAKPQEVAKPKPKAKKSKKASALPSEKTLAAVNKAERAAAKAAPAKRAYSAPKVKNMTGKRAKEILTKAGMAVPAKAADRVAQVKRIVRSPAKEPVKGMGPLQRGYLRKKAKKPAQAKPAQTKPAQPKGPSVADQKAAIAKMTNVQLSNALKAAGFAVTKIGTGAKGSKTVSRAKAISKLQGRVNKAGRAEKAAKSGKPARPQRRNQKQKDTKTKAETQKAEAPKAAKAAPAAEKGVNLAAELGYRGKAKQKALNTFFRERKVSTLNDLVENKETLARALGAVRGGTGKVASGKGLLKRINTRISDVRGKGGAGSPIPKAREATGRRAAQGRTKDRSAREIEDKVAERAAREVRSGSGPTLRGIASDPIKGTKALFTKLAKGEISPAQMKRQLKPILAKAKPGQKADFNRALDFFTRMQINMRAAKKAGKVRPEDTKALNNAAKQLRQMLATIALAAGMGAAAE